MADGKENVGDKLYDGVRDVEDAIGLVDKDEKEQGGPSIDQMNLYRNFTKDQLEEEKKRLQEELEKTDDEEEKKSIQDRIDMIDDVLKKRETKGNFIVDALEQGKTNPEMEGPEK